MLKLNDYSKQYKMVEIVLEKLFTVSGWSPLLQLRLNGLYHSLTLLELNKCWFETLFVEMQFHLKAWDDAVFKGLSYNFISKVAIFTHIYTFDSRQRESTKRLENAQTYWEEVFTLNPLTPKIWLIILSSSGYTFPCKLVMRIWCSIKIISCTW